MTTSIDRRRFLTYTGAAGAATGALWVAPSVLGSSTAFALNSNSACAYAGKVRWSPTTADPWVDGSWVGGHLSGGRPGIPNNTGSVSFTAQVGGTGNSHVWVRFTVTAVASPPPVTGNPTFGTTGRISGSGGELWAGSSSWYRWSFVPDATSVSTGQGYQTTVEFFGDAALSSPVSVENLAFTIIDIDGINGSPGYRDESYLDGISPGSATFTSTVGSNVTPSTGGGTSSAPWRAISGSPTNDTRGTVNVNFTSPVHALTVHYANSNYAGQTTYGNSNGLAIGDLTWGCS